MASERDIRTNYRESTAGTLTPEGVDMGESPEETSFDRRRGEDEDTVAEFHRRSEEVNKRLHERTEEAAAFAEEGRKRREEADRQAEEYHRSQEEQARRTEETQKRANESHEETNRRIEESREHAHERAEETREGRAERAEDMRENRAKRGEEAHERRVERGAKIGEEGSRRGEERGERGRERAAETGEERRSEARETLQERNTEADENRKERSKEAHDMREERGEREQEGAERARETRERATEQTREARSEAADERAESAEEAEKNAEDVASEFHNAEMEHVQGERTDHGIAYFFVSPPEAIRLGWEPRIHIGDDDGSGKGLGPIAAAASEMTQRMHKEIEEAIAEERAASVNRTVNASGHEVPDDDLVTPAVVVGDGGAQHVSADVLEHAHTIDEAHEKYTEESSRQTIEQVSEGLPHPGEIKIEEIPVEDAGLPQYEPEVKVSPPHQVFDEFPPEAFETPQKPLDPEHPKTHVRGPVPGGELVSEPHVLPPEPSGPGS
jgi:hypothetical protein